jgi:serine/threonine protein kinase
MNRFVKEHCRSPFVSTIEGSFKIPHHLAQTDARYAGIEFDAVFYPLAGTDLRRISSPWCYPNHPDNPLPSCRLKQCIRELVLGLAALHKIGVVHGGE